MIRVLHTIGSLHSDSGGPARSVQGLVAALDCVDNVVARLLSMDPLDCARRGGEGRLCVADKGGYWGALSAVEAAIRSARPDLIHIHAIWTPACHAVALAARRQGIPYVIAPRGMLEPWSLNAKKWKKRLALWLYQRNDINRAALLHATAQGEADQFRRLGFSRPILISPNGVTPPVSMPEQNLRTDGRRRVLFVSRIHPKKGLLELLDAWASIKKSGWILEIVGTDADGYWRTVKTAIREKGLSDTVLFTGALDDDAKWYAYRRADLFVLPSYSENFGIVIAEALYAEVPVITTKGTPWTCLLGDGSIPDGAVFQEGSGRPGMCSYTGYIGGRCGWWVDMAVAPIREALFEAMNLSDAQRFRMGQNGRRLIEERFTWPPLAQQMVGAYKWLLDGGLGVNGLFV